MNRLFFAILVLIATYGSSSAQDCANALIESERLINSGNVESVPALLSNCLDQLSRQDKVEAYKKLTIAYLYMDDPFGAETSFLALLNEDPEYRVSPADPVELLYLSQQYITTPIRSITAKAGGNISLVSVIHHNSAETEYNDLKYVPRGGYNLQVGLDLHFSKIVSLFAEAETSMWHYNKVSTTNNRTTDLESERYNLQVAVPVGLRLTYPGEVSFPYVYAGYHPAFTFFASANDLNNPEKEAELRATGLNLTKQVNQFNHSLIFGLGYKRRIGQRFGYQYILVDLRFRMGMTNITNERTQFNMNDNNNDNQVHITKFLQVDDDYRWNTLELSVGYVWPKYKPRKKNSVTIQTTLKKWFSKKNKDE